MPQNDYLPFGNDPAANVITQTDYQNLPNRGTGLVAGLARSAVFNKIFRQLSMGVSALMEAVGNVRNVNITDDGNFGNLTSLLERAIAGATRWVNANTTLTADDAGLVLINAAGGAVTLTLPAAAAANGRPLRMQLVRTDASTNTVTIQRAGADLIDGAVSLLLPARARMRLVSDGVSSWIWLDDAGLPVGSVFYVAATAAPPNAIKGNGALLSRTAFARLWAHAQVSGNLVSDATWLAGGGPTMSYSSGDGSTTFRIPDLRGDFIRGWDDGRGVDAGRAIGSWQADAMQGHVHAAPAGTSGYWVSTTGGSVQFPNAGTAVTSATNTGSPTSDGANGTPRTANETRPRNGALLGCIRF